MHDPPFVVGGRFRCVALLGEGGAARVYLAERLDGEGRAAIKLLRPEGDPKAAARLEVEGRVLARLDHPHIVRLIDSGRTAEGRPYLALAHLGGGSLGDRLARGRLSAPTAVAVARAVASALACAHRAGIVHRDVKPDNVLFDEAGRPCLTDFGVARAAPGTLDEQLTAPGTRLGTPDYMAPEQAFARPIDARADLYALGALLYEMLTGHRPFVADCHRALYVAHEMSVPRRLRSICPDCVVPPDLEALVLRLLSKAPIARPASADDVLARLDRLAAALPAPHDAPALLPRTPRRPPTDHDAPLPTFRPPVRPALAALAALAAAFAAL